MDRMRRRCDFTSSEAKEPVNCERVWRDEGSQLSVAGLGCSVRWGRTRHPAMSSEAGMQTQHRATRWRPWRRASAARAQQGGRGRQGREDARAFHANAETRCGTGGERKREPPVCAQESQGLGKK